MSFTALEYRASMERARPVYRGIEQNVDSEGSGADSQTSETIKTSFVDVWKRYPSTVTLIFAPYLLGSTTAPSINLKHADTTRLLCRRRTLRPIRSPPQEKAQPGNISTSSRGIRHCPRAGQHLSLGSAIFPRSRIHPDPMAPNTNRPHGPRGS